jgi:alpha-glucosidase (family GH31 glycosyl hydrolase)
MTPLPLAFPQDLQVYARENTTVRGYQWMLGPSLLACPLYGNDYATAETRDVYLPAGDWMDFDTGQVYAGPKLLSAFPLPPGKTPLFIGGQGVLVLRDLKTNALRAKVYPVAPKGSEYRFTHADGVSRSHIRLDAPAWTQKGLRVVDLTLGKRVLFDWEPKLRAVVFGVEPGHDYRLEN